MGIEPTVDLLGPPLDLKSRGMIFYSHSETLDTWGFLHSPPWWAIFTKPPFVEILLASEWEPFFNQKVN